MKRLTLLLTLTSAFASASPQKMTLDRLLTAFQSLPGLEAHFSDEKHISLLAEPLMTEGVIDFAPPDLLARRTTKPAATAMVINGSNLSFNDGHTTEEMSLESNPVARLFVNSFLKILAGDSVALARLYEMHFHAGKGESWTLHLKPKVAPMSQTIATIDLDGNGVVIHRMRVVETSGDYTITTFSSVDAHRRFTAEERRQIFSATRP